jgi:hypothetical protein
MQNKFYKTVAVLAAAALVIVSVAYASRTVLDIACAAREPLTDGSGKRPHVLGINCWYWEGAVSLNIPAKL